MRMATPPSNEGHSRPGRGDDGEPARTKPESPRPRRLRLLRWLPEAWVLTRIARAHRMLYLSFDDGPHPQHTPRLLDLLAGHGIRATFFLIGERAQRHPALVRRIVAEGHRLGNHSWSHPDFERIGRDERREQVERTRRLLREFDGRDRHDFRPPRGAMPAGLLLDCLRRGQRLAYWSYDSLDYSHRDPAELVANVLREPVEAGDVILMHDDSDHSRRMLQALIPHWRAEGYGFDALPPRAGGVRVAVAARPADARE